MMILTLLFLLIAAHALCDFAFQTDVMAYSKNRHNPMRNIQPGAIPSPFWLYWLSAHALIHGGAVALLTGSVALGLAETLLHWGIDYAKCENWTNLHQDQMLHVASKVVWVALATL